MKNIICSLLLIALMASCGNSKSTTKSFKKIDNKALIGKWKQAEPIVTKHDYVIFDKHYYTYYFKEIDPVKDTYHIYKNLIIGSEIEVVNHRDSIKFEFLHLDTLVLDIKDKGEPSKVKHYRIKE